MNPCPPHDRLARLLNDELPDSDFPEIEAHIEACTACQAVLERLRETTGLSDWRRRWKEVFAPPAIPPPVSPEFIGRLDRFDIQTKLGSGAMGTVYQAYDSRLRRPVALKVVNPELAALPGFRGLFDREAALGGRHRQRLRRQDTSRHGRDRRVSTSVSGDGADRGGVAEGPSDAQGVPSLRPRRRASTSTSRWGWPPRTARDSSTATSSPRTSCSTGPLAAPG